MLSNIIITQVFINWSRPTTNKHKIGEREAADGTQYLLFPVPDYSHSNVGLDHIHIGLTYCKGLRTYNCIFDVISNLLVNFGHCRCEYILLNRNYLQIGGVFEFSD